MRSRLLCHSEMTWLTNEVCFNATFPLWLSRCVSWGTVSCLRVSVAAVWGYAFHGYIKLLITLYEFLSCSHTSSVFSIFLLPFFYHILFSILFLHWLFYSDLIRTFGAHGVMLMERQELIWKWHTLDGHSVLHLPLLWWECAAGAWLSVHVVYTGVPLIYKPERVLNFFPFC